MTVYKSMYLPTLLYRCETRVITEVMQRRFQAAEMKYLRRVANVTIMDKIRNEKIRNQLETECAKKYMQKAKLRWWGHLNRLDPSSKESMEGKKNCKVKKRKTMKDVGGMGRLLKYWRKKDYCGGKQEMTKDKIKWINEV